MAHSWFNVFCAEGEGTIETTAAPIPNNTMSEGRAQQMSVLNEPNRER